MTACEPVSGHVLICPDSPAPRLQREFGTGINEPWQEKTAQGRVNRGPTTPAADAQNRFNESRIGAGTIQLVCPFAGA